MAQISAPFRIALVAIVLLGAVWFVALRPKPDATTPAPLPVAPGVQGLSKDVQKARATTAAANAAVAKTQASADAAVNGTGGQSAPAAKPSVTKTKSATVTKTSQSGASVTKTATKTTKVTAATPKTVVVKPAAPKAVVVAKPKAKPHVTVVAASPAAPLIRALNHGKVVVLMFRNRSSDSAAVAASVRRLSRHHGKVVIRVVSISDVGKYSAFTRDTPVNQAPTTLIIGPSRKARVIVGFTDGGELGQAVDDLIVAKSSK